MAGAASTAHREVHGGRSRQIAREDDDAQAGPSVVRSGPSASGSAAPSYSAVPQGFALPYLAELGASGSLASLPRKIPVKVEPKAWFANERTLVAWVNMAVAFAGVASLLTSITGDSPMPAGAIISPKTVALVGVLLIPIAFAMVLYATFMFLLRTHSMQTKASTHYVDKVGPVVITSAVAAILLVMTVVVYYAYFAAHFAW